MGLIKWAYEIDCSHRMFNSVVVYQYKYLSQSYISFLLLVKHPKAGQVSWTNFRTKGFSIWCSVIFHEGLGISQFNCIPLSHRKK